MISVFAALYVRCFEAIVSLLNPSLPKFFVLKKLAALASQPFQAPSGGRLTTPKVPFQQDPCSAARAKHLQRARMTHHESMLLPDKIPSQLANDHLNIPGLRRRPRNNIHDPASFFLPPALSD